MAPASPPGSVTASSQLSLRQGQPRWRRQRTETTSYVVEGWLPEG